MAWSDEPTDNQINAVLNMIRWEISNEEIPRINAYLKEHTTRRELSKEFGRLRDLKISRKMNRDRAFDSEIWKNYNN